MAHFTQNCRDSHGVFISVTFSQPPQALLMGCMDINVCRYGLSKEQMLEAETALEELAAHSNAEAIVLPLVNIMGR